MSSEGVLVVTTAHWEGDPRLNRHVAYLTNRATPADLVSFHTNRRPAALARALVCIARTKAAVVILPDPELYLPGSLVARLTGKRAVIDIHEDYTKTAQARQWIPRPLRSLVAFLAGGLIAMGRATAWRVMVAAPELARDHDYVALNIPDPGALSPASYDGSNRLVYVGDLTVARGALAMVDVLAALDDTYELLLIGRAGPETLRLIRERSAERNVLDRVVITGRLPHTEAWERASGSLVGLNLLEPVPAYREAVATKLWEYMAVGLPPLVSDLPGQARLLSRVDPDLVCAGPEDAAAVIGELGRDHERRRALGDRARATFEDAWAANRPDRVVQEVVLP